MIAHFKRRVRWIGTQQSGTNSNKAVEPLFYTISKYTKIHTYKLYFYREPLPVQFCQCKDDQSSMHQAGLGRLPSPAASFGSRVYCTGRPRKSSSKPLYRLNGRF